jgi:hypothetical protein
VGRPLTEVVPGPVRGEIVPHCQAALDGNSAVIHIRTLDERRRFDVDVLPLADADGAIEGGMMVARDVTDRHNRQVLGRALRRQDT